MFTFYIETLSLDSIICCTVIVYHTRMYTTWYLNMRKRNGVSILFMDRCYTDLGLCVVD